MKIKYKIAVYFSVICSAIIGLTGIFIYYFFADHLEKQFRQRLVERAIIAAEILLEEDEVGPNRYESIKRKYLQTLPEEKVFYLNTATGPDFSEIPSKFINNSALEISRTKGYSFYKVDELQVCSLYYEDNEGNYIILLAARNEEGKAQLAYLIQILLSIVIVALFFIVAVSLLFANHILRPINRMIEKMDDISGSKLQLRLEESKGRDEISRLAKTFNGMLSRLETSFYSQEKFIQNASHELRTPLTVILGEAEYALKSKDLQPTEKLAFEKIYQEAEHLRRLLKSLLQLSEIKSDSPRKGFMLLRIDELIQQVVIRMNEHLPAGKIHLEYKNIESLTPASFEVLGNELWLEIAFNNLLNNALKYSDNNPVEIILTHSTSKVIVTIHDRGIGIPKLEMEKILKPFYRGTNTLLKKGYGIGLNLTHNIISIHKGELFIYSVEAKGSTVKIEFPVAKAF